jgi:hypothetical protein
MTRKLDKEHLDAITQLREQYSRITMTLGNMTIEEIATQRQLETIQQEKQSYINELGNLQQQENELISKLRERYGDGEINIANGTFTPNE